MALDNDNPVSADKFGIVAKVPYNPGPHWLWVFDTNFISFSDGRAHLIDGDSGRYLGSLNTGYVHAKLDLPQHYREIYSVETYYSRHVGGERTDLVRVYDPVNLTLLTEIPIPNKRATTIPRLSNSALTGDDKFLLVYNLTPATSVSVVDLTARKFVAEFDLPGCGGIYPAGGYRFMSICSDGALLVYSIDKNGYVAEKKRTKVIFDPDNDPLIEYPVRYKDGWLFNSMESQVYRIDTGGTELKFYKPWSLLDQQDRQDGWRIGGMQQIAINERHKLLFTIMHQGAKDTYEQAGPEIWVYDLKNNKRIRRIKPMRNAISIHVSSDDKPLLFSLVDTENVLDIYDALSGEQLRSVEELGVTPVMMQTPPYNK